MKKFILLTAIVCLFAATSVFADSEKISDIGYWTAWKITEINASEGPMTISAPFHIPWRMVDSVASGQIYWQRDGEQVHCPKVLFVDHPVMALWWEDAVEKTLKRQDVDLYRLVEKIARTWNDPVVSEFLVERIRYMADGILEGRKSLTERTQFIFSLYALHVRCVYGY